MLSFNKEGEDKKGEDKREEEITGFDFARGRSINFEGDKNKSFSRTNTEDMS
jgi:hypothetical protein